MPTILEFTGYAIPAGRMGLGYSAFNQHPIHPPLDRLANMDQDLLNRSEQYIELWTDPDDH
jgi:phosphoglycerol transferase